MEKALKRAEFLSDGFVLSGNCAENNFHTDSRNRIYRCEATSIKGFVQQLAVSYLANGYWFYAAGSVPEGKDPRAIDQKLIEKYGINVSKWTRARQRKRGISGIQYLRFQRFFILLATHGVHRFFREEQVRDARERPIRFAGYSISVRKGRDEKWHPSVRIDAIEFKLLKAAFLEQALTRSEAYLASRFARLPFVPYAPVRDQYRQLLRAVNRKRRLAGLELLPISVLPIRRQPVLPF